MKKLSAKPSKKETKNRDNPQKVCLPKKFSEEKAKTGTARRRFPFTV